MNNSDCDLSSHLTEHYENERETLRLLLELEKDFREFYNNYLCEVGAQQTLLDRIWLLTQRYIILCSTGPCCKYPEVYTLSAEEAIINEYQEKWQKIRASNNRLKHEALSLYKQCKEFYATYNKLDHTLETPFILGDKFHKPIKYFKEMVNDIFNYFYACILKMKVRLHQLDPINCTAVEDYKPLLKRSEEFEEYLLTEFTYCKCLYPEPECPIVKHKCPKFNL